MLQRENFDDSHTSGGFILAFFFLFCSSSPTNKSAFCFLMFLFPRRQNEGKICFYLVHAFFFCVRIAGFSHDLYFSRLVCASIFFIIVYLFFFADGSVILARRMKEENLFSTELILGKLAVQCLLVIRVHNLLYLTDGWMLDNSCNWQMEWCCTVLRYGGYLNN